MENNRSIFENLAAYLETFGLSENDLYEAGDVSESGVIAAAAEDYLVDRHSAFAIEPDRCALIVVDMQVGFVRRESPQWIPQAERIVPVLSHLADVCRTFGIPVILTSANFLNPSPNDSLAFTEAIEEGNLAEGSEGVEIIPELYRPGDQVIENKRTYCAFHQTDLDYRLRAHRRDTVIVTGTMTNFCCEATARTAFDLGYHVVFPSDLNATDNPLCHEATLQTMRRGYARVLDSTTLIRMMKSHPRDA